MRGASVAARVTGREKQLALQAVDQAATIFRHELERFVHPGREQSVALTKVDEAAMWAARGIELS